MAPTLALTAIVSCGVVGVAVGQTFVRPPLGFETSLRPDAAGGGQAGMVEPRPSAPVPAGGSRTGRAPRPLPVRDLPTTPPDTSAPAPARTEAAPTSPASEAAEPSAAAPSPAQESAAPSRNCEARDE